MVSAPPTMGYQTQTTNAPKKKSPVAIILIAVFGLCGLCGLGGFGLYTLGEAHSGMYVDGVELTRTEKKNGIKEMEAMIENVEPGKTDSLDLSVEATSPLSKKYKYFLTELANGETTLTKFTTGVDLDTIMGKSMVLKANREAAHKAVIDFDKHVDDYFNHQINLLDQFQSFFDSTLKVRDSTVTKKQSGLASMQLAYTTFSRARLKYLDFLNVHPPAALQGDAYLFEKDSDIDQCNKLVKEFSAAGDAYDKITKATLGK
jgi:hypothetical protein